MGATPRVGGRVGRPSGRALMGLAGRLMTENDCGEVLRTSGGVHPPHASSGLASKARARESEQNLDAEALNLCRRTCPVYWSRPPLSRSLHSCSRAAHLTGSAEAELRAERHDTAHGHPALRRHDDALELGRQDGRSGRVPKPGAHYSANIVRWNENPTRERGSGAEPLSEPPRLDLPASQVSGSGSPVLVPKISRTLGNASAAATAPPRTSRAFLTR